MKKIIAFMVFVASCLAIWVTPAMSSDSTPQLINYQGRLSGPSGAPLADGSTVDMRFLFHDASSGGNLLLTVVQEDVVVSGGIYNVLIGSGTVLPGVESSLSGVFQNHNQVWMGVKVDDDDEMTPRSRIGSVPFALKTDTAWLDAYIGSMDFDGDGHRKMRDGGDDCNDGDASVHPAAAEDCGDKVDNDCDGLIDRGDPDCAPPPGMALIPTGCFDMGNGQDNCTIPDYQDECPVHNVCITSDFFMDKHEVTNAEYAACVTAGACTPPADTSSFSRTSYYGHPYYNAFPVIHVDWSQAADYCAWAGKRLPTEAEWEYAARGGLSQMRYAWGDTVSGTDANYYNSGDPWDNDTSPVQYYAANGYGLYDVAGNVSEWVNDRYSDIYYLYSPVNDPPGPLTGNLRVYRGGSFGHNPDDCRVSERAWALPANHYMTIGIRCAKDE